MSWIWILGENMQEFELGFKCCGSYMLGFGYHHEFLPSLKGFIPDLFEIEDIRCSNSPSFATLLTIIMSSPHHKFSYPCLQCLMPRNFVVLLIFSRNLVHSWKNFLSTFPSSNKATVLEVPRCNKWCYPVSEVHLRNQYLCHIIYVEEECKTFHILAPSTFMWFRALSCVFLRKNEHAGGMPLSGYHTKVPPSLLK